MAQKPLQLDHLIDQLPGDKSMSHRSIILGSLTEGVSTFTNFLTAEDCLNTLEIFRQLGVHIERSGTTVTIHGVGISGLRDPGKPLDVGNSGTGIRLITGILAGLPFTTTISGDESIEKRPMKRIIDPLSQMGAHIEGQSLPGKHDIYPPLTIHGTTGLTPIRYTLPVASAQVKSAVLLAGLLTIGDTVVVEPEPCRDHTERFLAGFGADFDRQGTDIRVSGRNQLKNPSTEPIHIPSDVSSAAFFIVLAAILKQSKLRISGVGINPTRDAVVTALKQMGAMVSYENKSGADFEPYADVVVESSAIVNTHLEESLVPFLIDEIPILAVAAMFGQGTFKVTGAKELRVKESDRIKSIVGIVTAFGGQIIEYDDGFEVQGGFEPPTDVSIAAYGDHRIAMSAIIAAIASGVSLKLDDVSCILTSFPNFMDLLRGLGVQL